MYRETEAFHSFFILPILVDREKGGTDTGRSREIAYQVIFAPTLEKLVTTFPTAGQSRGRRTVGDSSRTQDDPTRIVLQPARNSGREKSSPWKIRTRWANVAIRLWCHISRDPKYRIQTIQSEPTALSDSAMGRNAKSLEPAKYHFDYQTTTRSSCIMFGIYPI